LFDKFAVSRERKGGRGRKRGRRKRRETCIGMREEKF